ncbi:DUF881 domain-containing protein [Modestobacter sp. VKM Ac-2984]|uniref:DUF881 domain-containing protein n=1 Tax=Modestobacter sp. VKM Ac-2984 TaxID=3004138 RepID=UPI0022AA71DF|nr:DUF881 domain-containing protein [Modestobacter sp. VKM Ac-2984]MCZ2816286.1 DUF881 domain-containing protein [Modestobacter sp. VKM Ac-2984]
MSEDPTVGPRSGAEPPEGDSPDTHTPDAHTAQADPAGADGVGEPEAGPPAAGDGGGAMAAGGRRRRDPLAAVLIGVLTLLLGFAFAVQVRSTDTDAQLAGLREEDLVRILDDLSAREDRLRQEISDQRTALSQLGSSDSAAAAALAEAEQRAEALGILNGTVAARGPGLEVVVRDPADRVTAGVVLNAIQELRGAGAETMQIDDVRIGVSSAITGEPGALEIDGEPVEAPYVIRVIGSPQDMATALDIPGGFSATVNQRRGDVEITPSQDVVVDALRPLDTPQYAEPDDGD